MTWTYSLATLASSEKDQVRFRIGDTNEDDPQLQDEEIELALSVAGSVVGAAVISLQALAAAYSRKADTTTGELRTLWSSQARAYAARAQELRNELGDGAFASPYVGGISIADKISREVDTDRVRPAFERGMNDNLNQPVGPVDDGTSLTGG